MSDIVIQGAREHNLKGIDVAIPRNSFTVITGVSGSGKSSLAFDTIYQEGQRRFLESLSAYTRQYLGNMSKPKLDHASGLSPTVAIDQKTVNKNPRSTVGTITEIYDYLRLLYARLGTPHCPRCGKIVSSQTPANILESLFTKCVNQPLMVLAPIVQERKGEYRREIEQLRLQGYTRARIDGEVVRLDQPVTLSRYVRHSIEVVIDRIQCTNKFRSRLMQDIELALEKGRGSVAFLAAENPSPDVYSVLRACPDCRINIPELEPRLFSFNSPVGSCAECHGLGRIQRIEPKLVVPNPRLSLRGGAIASMKNGKIPFGNFGMLEIEQMAVHFGFSMDAPWEKLNEKHQALILYGAGEERMAFQKKWNEGGTSYRSRALRRIKGVIPAMQQVLRMSKGRLFEQYAVEGDCTRCSGRRLSAISLAVTFRDLSIDRMAAMTVDEMHAFFRGMKLGGHEQSIAQPILREILSRLNFLRGVGLTYLTLDRSAATLAGGESQRIRLARQLGAGLQGVIYVLDEPSIGLHPRDNGRLLSILRKLRDHNNTVIVVEHDEETIHASDFLLDIGPGAGRDGGEIVSLGRVPGVKKCPRSMTGQYLSGKRVIPIPRKRGLHDARRLRLIGARVNNLKDVVLDLPLGRFVVVTGVSGSGKSSLVQLTLKRALSRALQRAGPMPGDYDRMEGFECLDKVIEVDQSPIGRTPRSNPATYTKLMDRIRDLFAALPEAKMRGYTKSRFSFNVTGGRCEECGGAGVRIIEMQFLADVQVPCDACQGRRYNPETLAVTFKGKNIAQILDMSVHEAWRYFEHQPRIRAILQTMRDVGLDYVALGQPSTTLSGGEAQRVKLASELHRPSTGRTMYILDEPTTGLHMADVHRLIDGLQKLVDRGNTVLLVEHHLDVIKVADYIVDMGPEGGAQGGEIIAAGPPEALADQKHSHTGQALARLLGHERVLPRSRLSRAKGANGHIVIEGACKHNLQHIDVRIPHNAITVITGVSGSGKSTLAFDTVFSEGQRKFIESMSTYARRFLGRLDQGEVRSIQWLAPSIAINQTSAYRNPRSTVATSTEIYDYLRLLFARVGLANCPRCGIPLSSHTPFQAWQSLIRRHEGEQCILITPITDPALPVPDARGAAAFKKTLQEEGFVRLYIRGRMTRLHETDDLQTHWRDLHLVLTRRKIVAKNRAAIIQALELGFARGRDHVLAVQEGGRILQRFASHPSCDQCGYRFEGDLSPSMFSFNSHMGACETCDGLGKTRQVDPSLLIQDADKPLLTGALFGKVGRYISRGGSYYRAVLKSVARREGFSIRAAWKRLAPAHRKLVMYGNGETYRVIQRRNTALTRSFRKFDVTWTGLVNVIQDWYGRSDGGDWTAEIERVMSSHTCPACEGKRLKRQYLAVTVQEKGIADVCRMTITQALRWVESLSFHDTERTIAEQILVELRNRLRFLEDVGLGYLNLSRNASTLSGGEAQRMRMATQLGNRLVGVIYVLDEPTIGLHPVDVQKLLDSLVALRDLGNTVIMVEHDRDAMHIADYIVDMGPGAGRHGGRVVVSGPLSRIRRSKKSLTGRYLSGSLSIPVPRRRRRGCGARLELKGACANNLKHLDVSFPLETFIAVTGVSGSGKSSLIFRSLLSALKGEGKGKHWRSLAGHQHLVRTLVVNQKPIGRTPHSNPATFTKVFDAVREVYAKTPDARMKGYGKGRFSFNNASGQCAACEGMGMVRVEMHFLSDVWIPCEECQGTRYNQETMSVRYRGKTIADVLEMEIEEACTFFKHHPKIKRTLQLMCDVGLGYMKLGQSATTLSGGEAQRVKLSAELCRRGSDRTLYLLDEPTIGLHMADIKNLLKVLKSLVDRGNTVIVIEHNLDVIKVADHVIDLGPKGGEAGGLLMAQGSPSQVARSKRSETGMALRKMLGMSSPA